MFDVRWVLVLAMLLTACGDDSSDPLAIEASPCTDGLTTWEGPVCIGAVGFLTFEDGVSAQHTVDIQAWESSEVVVDGWTSRSNAYMLEIRRNGSADWTVIGAQGGGFTLPVGGELVWDDPIYGPSITLQASERAQIRLSYDGAMVEDS